MIAQNACFACLQNQAQKLCSRLCVNDIDIESLLNKARNTPLPPPKIAIDVYGSIAERTGIEDPFFHIKQESMQKAHNIAKALLRTHPAPELEVIEDTGDSIGDTMRDTIEEAPQAQDFRESTGFQKMKLQYRQHFPQARTQAKSPQCNSKFSPQSIAKHLSWAIYVAALGNVIDYGAQDNFSFEQADFALEHLQFAKYDLQAFTQKLQNAKTMLYIADNAGENIFDEVLISSLKTIYPHLHITYATRGAPIINDLTLQDLSHPLASNLKAHCTLLDSGVKSPGFIYEDASGQTQDIYNQADIILSKGMGNFECLHERKDSRLFLLFKVKCDVVATFCDVKKGMMMFIHNHPTQKD